MSAALGAATPRPGLAAGQLASIVRPWRGSLAVAGALVLSSALAELVPPILMRRIVDDHLTVGVAEGLLWLALAYLGASVAVDTASALATYLIARSAEGALHALRVRTFEHLQRLPIDYFDRTPLGDVISRCTADVETIEVLFSSGVAKVVADLARLATAAVAMALLSPPLALATALVLPPLLAITRLFQVRVRAAERANRAAVGLLNTHLQESLSGVEVIRAFTREDHAVARFRAALREALAAFNRATVYSAFYTPTMALLAALATALLLWAGSGGGFAAAQVSLGTLTAFVLLFQRFFKPITALGDEWQTVQSALSGAERVFQVLALPPDEGATVDRSERRNGSASPRGRRPAGPVAELRDVTFGYRAGQPVLHGVSLAVRTGEHVALVGRTGAGKSSALHLLGGLYAPWSGSVRVGDRDPRTLSVGERRRLVGAVPQVVQLFGGSVLDNLTLLDPTLERAAAERAARIAGADAFIRALPDGYDTPLSGSGRGEGVQLSAGQRQLLALARALVADPLLLLLDEATAAVDGTADGAFRAALRVEADRRAVLVVAHRLATAREADRVLVLEAGRVVEEGRPDELIRRGGRFAALAELEEAGWDW